MGYAGGQTPNPDYGHIGDHTETVQLDYDPRRISYADLLEIFWESHTPTQATWSRQYVNAIFFHNDAQWQTAMASKAVMEKKIRGAVTSEVLPLRSFTLAEDYHQKYLLKSRSVLAREMTAIYSNENDFMNSTAVTRLNGYVGGNGSGAQLVREIQRLGLSPKGQQFLIDLVRTSGR